MNKKQVTDFLRDPRILYFCADAVPTLADIVAARKLGRNVVFRNGAAAAQDASAPELCDGVAGPAIPKAYEDKPKGATVIKARDEEIKAAIDAAEADEQAAIEAQAEADAEAQKRHDEAEAQRAATGKPAGAAAAWTPAKR